MPPYARRRHLVAGNEHDAWVVLPRIEAPTLILHGEDDRLTPAANAASLASRIAQARVHNFEGARHGYFQECRPPSGGRVVIPVLVEQESPRTS
jgi:pimeloyl-ACP methyl ester carboxylesterase